MIDFTYFSPTKVIFGKKAIEKLGSTLAGDGCKKVLLHYGGGSVKKNGIFDAVVKQLSDNGIAYCELGGVAPNPKIGLIREGAELCKKEGVDFILAVGGGSVIDSAKGIAMGATVDFDVWMTYTGEKKIRSALPIGSVLTLAAAGSELSSMSVVTNPDGDLKKNYTNECQVPKYAFMNPEYTFSVSKYQTACGVVDIIMHTFERYFTITKDVELTDEIGEGLVRTVIHQGPIAVENPNDYESRATLMWAGSLSHNGLTGTGRIPDWATHMIEHEVSGIYDFVSHGAGLAALFPAWCKYVYKNNIPRFVRWATKIWGCETAGKTDEEVILDGIAKTEAFFKSIGMPVRLSELKVDSSRFEEMARKAVNNDAHTLGCIKPLTQKDIVEIYRLAQ